MYVSVFLCRTSEIITYGRTKIAVFVIFLFALGYNLVRFFEVTWFEHVKVVDGVNVTVVDITTTEMRQNELYISIYITWSYLVFMYVIPFGGLSVLNLLMFLDVRRSNDRNVTLSSSQKKEMKLAVMLMIVVLVFLICNVLPFIVNIMELFAFSYKPLTEISNLLVTINSRYIFITFKLSPFPGKKQTHRFYISLQLQHFHLHHLWRQVSKTVVQVPEKVWL